MSEKFENFVKKHLIEMRELLKALKSTEYDYDNVPPNSIKFAKDFSRNLTVNSISFLKKDKEWKLFLMDRVAGISDTSNQMICNDMSELLYRFIKYSEGNGWTKKDQQP